MSNRKRDPDGYSLGAIASKAVARRVLEILATNKRERLSPRTQGEVSRITKIPAPHLSDLLRGEGDKQLRNFQGWQVRAIAAAFEMGEHDLLGDVAIVPQVANPTRGTSYLAPRARPPTPEQLKYLAEHPGEAFVEGLVHQMGNQLEPGLVEHYKKHGATMSLLVARVMADERAWSEPDLIKDADYYERKQAFWENELQISKVKRAERARAEPESTAKAEAGETGLERTSKSGS